MSSESSPPASNQAEFRINDNKETSYHSNQEDINSTNNNHRAASINSDEDGQTEGISNSTATSNNNPPLPAEPPPSSTITEQPVDDGWQPVWEESAGAYYFYNKFTGVTTWTNPRVPEAAPTGAPGIGNHDRIGQVEEEDEEAKNDNSNSKKRRRPHGGYDPSIHGDYDPTAPYAQEAAAAEEDEALQTNSNHHLDPAAAAVMYGSTGAFNRFTGKWQSSSLTPENFNDENKSRRQMSAFFDVDAAANRHDGKSLKAERAGKKLTKKEVKAFKDKRRERKEEKRRAWLRD